MFKYVEFDHSNQRIIIKSPIINHELFIVNY